MAKSLLKMQHSSLQFSDTPAQQHQDIHDLFALGGDYPIKTGTEAGSNKNADFLKKFAKEFDHALHIVRANWIAVDRSIIKKGTLTKAEVFVIDNDHLVGKMHDRVMATMSWDHIDPIIGQLSIGACHYPTKGARPGDPNYRANVLYADKIATWMKGVGRGRKIAFANGDFNMPDRTLDWSFGNNFTSMADELKAWQNTGHGPIDGFCSYDRDHRVKAKKFQVLTDKEFPQFSDHYVCRGVWEVNEAPQKKAA